MKVLAASRLLHHETSFGLTKCLEALVFAAILFLGVRTQAAVPVRIDSPTVFFTNVATRLLRSELNLDLNNIQVYPTNQYTPAVHRLLQVTANLYDSTTNRGLGLTPEYPYCPSVFRPLFRRLVIGTNTCIVISGYREVVNANMADSRLAPLMIDLTREPSWLMTIRPYGAPFDRFDRNEPMVSGVPLVIGARTGFPNFNEFSMQTQILVTRLLEFRRAPGSVNGPIVETNLMYVIGISNTFGLEAWNSYLTNYPRDLRLIASVSMTAILTNETGAANVLLSNTVIQAASLAILANSWSGWTSPSSVNSSMILPFGTTNSFFFLTNSTYMDGAPWFLPQTHIFPNRSGFYVPHWWLNLNTRLLFILVDTNANRIVDYLNLNHAEQTVDITAKLADGSTVSAPSDYQNPANQWLTNRLGDSTSVDSATYGIINQLLVGLNGPTDRQSYVLDPYAGLDAQSAVDGFRYNLVGFGPIYPKDIGKTFYKSNVFYAPFDPYRPIYIHTTWQANDPFVHYLVNDLLDLSLGETNSVDFMGHIPPLSNLGQINNRYSPWGGNPLHVDPATDYQIALKDPGVMRPDDWDFPTNQALAVSWVGRVHRGTPWQTIFLKSTNILQQNGSFDQNLLTWARWTGNNIVVPDWLHPDTLRMDALFTVPTNDWHLVSFLNDLFNTNDVRRLVSPNLATTETWLSLLDGMTVFTNPAPGQLTPVIMSSNSSQAALIAQALLDSRDAQPTRQFVEIGDILATPELSIASPWLTGGPGAWVTDEALESIPSQLLPLLRPDSLGTSVSGSQPSSIQFSGMNGHSYLVQQSSDLLNWTSVTTNVPENGVFNFTPVPGTNSPQFYRSALQP